jgi:hypothetical protein
MCRPAGARFATDGIGYKYIAPLGLNYSQNLIFNCAAILATRAAEGSAPARGIVAEPPAALARRVMERIARREHPTHQRCGGAKRLAQILLLDMLQN